MAEFKINTPIVTDQPAIEVTVTAPGTPAAAGTQLAVGRHRFRLVVTDDSANLSDPDEVDVIVRDAVKPTAVLEAPKLVDFGKSFELSGRRSTDAGGGKVVSFTWTLMG